MTNNPTIDGVCKTCHGSGKEYDGAAHTCTACNGLGGVPAAEPFNELREHCKQCAEVVKTWPEWKRDCLGGAPAVERQEPAAFRFKWDYDHGNGWCRGAVRFVESMEEADHEDKSTWREITPLYEAAPDVAALQSTIAQLRIDLGNQTELTKQADYHASQRGNEIAQLQARVQELESGRGEADAWALLNGGGLIRDLTDRWDVAKHWDGIVEALYFAPPGPVAVVLPESIIRDAERYRFIRQGNAESDYICLSKSNEEMDAEIDTCLDATAALNGERK